VVSALLDNLSTLEEFTLIPIFGFFIKASYEFHPYIPLQRLLTLFAYDKIIKCKM
jgi:hypothetical protein